MRSLQLTAAERGRFMKHLRGAQQTALGVDDPRADTLLSAYMLLKANDAAPVLDEAQAKEIHGALTLSEEVAGDVDAELAVWIESGELLSLLVERAVANRFPNWELAGGNDE